MKTLLASLVLAGVSTGFATEYHVSVKGADTNPGSAASAFRTLQHAADIAQPGDTITVHAGIYRERVTPPRGGESDSKRIIYQAARGEKVVITGSDKFNTWEKVSGDSWKLVIPNSHFGAFNPYAENVHGDWFSGQGHTHRRGNVYLNGEWLAEAPNLDAVMKPAGAKPMWFSVVDGLADGGPQYRINPAAGADATAADANAMTTIYARFPGINPNEGAVEVCVRPTVFTPERTHIDYITVRGFELRNAATNWAAPTSGQVGLITAYWCKGWIIEDNEICYSRCGGVVLGKYSDKWDGTRGTTEGYYLTIEDALKKDGWSKDRIGSHIVRNNHIHHCGQVGIVGSLGCAFSRIEGNDIHDCNMQGIWGGAEMGGIKFHGAIDTVITGNHIHHNGPPGGLWLDWMAQGTQITGNLFHDNQGHDLFTEVNHGPILAANNLFLSPGAYLCNSRGTAFAHNLVLGSLQVVPDARRTPFMKPHSTETIGLHDCPVGDTRWYNNWLGGSANLDSWDKAGAGWPCSMAGNVFTHGSKASKFDTATLEVPDHDTAAQLTERGGSWYLRIHGDPAWAGKPARQTVGSSVLGKAIIPGQEFTGPDGEAVLITTDYFGTKRDPQNPFPGPFEQLAAGERQVWPK